MAQLIKDLTSLEQLAVTLKSKKKIIVTTNGVFDILHVGHVRYLQFCKQQGDVLIVGVNADSSVKQNKGDKRPIVHEADRAELIAALRCVDFVYIFSEKTPETWLEKVKPSIHIKAGDYTLDPTKETPKTKIHERVIVEKFGGKVMLAPLVDGISTTNIIGKILDIHK